MPLQMTSYADLRRICQEIAESVGPPRFTVEKHAMIEKSRIAYERSGSIRECLRIVSEGGNIGGHGPFHLRQVAIEAGAVVLLEAPHLPPDNQPEDRLYNKIERLTFLAQVAGVLHDIRRSQPDHARLGAIEAGRILEDRSEAFAIDADEREMIVQAIANHEAFQPAQKLERPDAQLLSDALYDADKFRWGPENFTLTLWDILESRSNSKGVPGNLPALFERFPRGLEGVERIRSTFRTATGRTYGPDFIDRGLEIGRRLYALWKEGNNTPASRD